MRLIFKGLNEEFLGFGLLRMTYAFNDLTFLFMVSFSIIKFVISLLGSILGSDPKFHGNS